jgi:hypothetical protein
LCWIELLVVLNPMPGIVNGVGMGIAIPQVHGNLWIVGNGIQLMKMRFIPGNEVDLSFSFNKHK